MRIAMSLLVLSLAIGPAACKKKPAATGAGSSEMGSGSAMAGSNEMGSAGSNEMGSGSAMEGSAGSNEMGSGSAAMGGSGMGSAEAAAMAHKAGNCPSTVFGATSAAEVKGKSVVLTITATTPDEAKSIQKRTDELLKHPNPGKATSDAHDQKGAHGGSMGLCPLHVPEGATAKAKHEKNGVMVTITPKDNPEGLKADLDARIARAKQWTDANIKSGEGGMGGTGGGSGTDGSNHSGKGNGHKHHKGGGSGTGDGTGGGTGGGK